MMSDYMLELNEFSLEHFKEDYMLDNLFKGKYVLGGYPRNSAFFNTELRNEIKEKYELQDKKIILYAYDKEEYFADRGMYLNYDKLPFAITTNTDQVIDELKRIDEYEDYSEFIEKFCKYDSKNAGKILCDFLLKNKEDKFLKTYEGESFANNKENVLIFAGALLKNGITTALKGIINNIDLSKRNYIITFYKSSIEKNKMTINDFSEVTYIPMQGQKNFTIREAINNFAFYRLKINTNHIKK